MAYTLDQFCAEARAALKADPGHAGREAVRQALEKLLANKEFVEATFPSDDLPPVRELYKDPDLGFLVLAHWSPSGGRRGPPHSHGKSWAAYGQAKGVTEMTVWRRKDAGAGPGPAEIEVAQEFALNEGQAGLFDDGAIHSTKHDLPTALIRVTGCDLDTIPRLRFDPDKKQAIQMAVKAA